MIHLSHKPLKEIMLAELNMLGVHAESASHMIESIISTSLRGTDSHGINLFPHYYNVLKIGRVNRNPEIRITSTKKTAAILEADYAPGHYAGAKAMDSAIKMAREFGSGWVCVKNSTHFGAAAYFGLMPAREDMIGFAFTNADALVKVHNAKPAYFGTNPICVTAPLLNEEPFCLDMATSLVSWNKIRNCRATNTPVPSDWGFDENGVSQADPHKLRSLRPSGDYKGFGLGMVVEVLCGVLSNGPLGPDIGPMFVELERKRSVSHFFGALDISSFCDVNCFKKRLQDCVEFIRGLQSTSQDPVMVAGDPEKRSYANRIQAGIPMEEAKFYELLKITKEFERARVS